MNSAVFIILTDEHENLNESVSLIKSSQKRYSTDISTHDMSHLSGKPIDDKALYKIKSTIDLHRSLDSDAIILVVGEDDEQFVSVMNSVAGKYNPPIVYVQNGTTIPLI